MKFLSMLFVLLSAFNLNAQFNNETQLKGFINKCVSAISKQDSIAVNKLINPNEGFYLIHNSGAFTQYVKTAVVSFNEAYPFILLKNAAGLKPVILKKGSLPIYSCEKEKWSKSGSFYNPKMPIKALSNLCEMRNKYVPDNIPQGTINKFKALEKNSRLIYIISNNKSLILLVTFTNNVWYLTAIDDATGDCSA